MGEPNEPPYSPARKHRRYDLCYPVHIQFPAGDSVAEVDVVSRNVSVGGMLLESALAIPKGSPVSLTMKIEGVPVVPPLQVSAEGRVVRVVERDPGFSIAIECSHPMAHVERLLSAAQG